MAEEKILLDEVTFALAGGRPLHVVCTIGSVLLILITV